MKKHLLLFVLLLLFVGAHAQTVVSSCSAPDSIAAKYKDDAMRLALRNINLYNSPYKDSILIPQASTDTVMKALLAVYNAVGLPARDSVVSKWKIHSLGYLDLRLMEINADKSLAWMQQLNTSHALPTGNGYIDSIFSKYHFQFSNYYQFNIDPTGSLYIISDSNYNIPAFKNLFVGAVQGISSIEKWQQVGDGGDITDTIYADHVRLVYTLGWDDCPSGCNKKHSWVFDVYYDCTVTYIGSSGAPVGNLAVQNIAKANIKVYPSPFTDVIMVEGLSGSFSFSVKDLTGKVVTSGKSDNGKITNLGSLAQGIYALQVQKDGGSIVIKLVKNK